MNITPLYKKILALLGAFVLALSFVFAVVGFFPTTAKTVSAEEVETVAEEVVVPNDNDNEYFGFADGASIMVEPLKLSFMLQQKNSYYDNRLNWTGEYSALRFTLYRYDGEKTSSSAKYDILIFSIRENIWGKIRTHVYFCAYEIEYDEGIDFSGVSIYPKQLADEDITYEKPYEQAKNFYLYGFTQYKVLYEGIRWTATQGDEEPHCNPFEFDRVSEALPYIRVSFPVSGVTTSYFAKANYVVSLNDGINDKSGTMTSTNRSIYDVTKAIDNAGKIETEFKTQETQAKAREIIQAVETGKTIKLNYLRDIDGTYFSEKVSAEITVPIIGGALGVDDVTTALGVGSLKAQNGYVKGFVANADQTEWTAQYLSSIWLKTRTSDGDGHYISMFLDLNESYGSYFKRLVGKITNGQGLYEYMWNGFIDEYPVLYGKDADKIHGFFGLIWIPKRNVLTSFNEAAKSLLNLKNEEVGFIRAIRGEQAITLTEHKALMKAYNYNWMASVWDEVADFAMGEQTTAEYYFFAAKPMEYVGISQTGDASEDDDDGVLENVARDPLGSLGDALGDFFGLGDGVGGVIERVVSLLVVVGIAAGVIYIVLYFKTGGAIGGSGKRKRK